MKSIILLFFIASLSVSSNAQIAQFYRNAANSYRAGARMCPEKAACYNQYAAWADCQANALRSGAPSCNLQKPTCDLSCSNGSSTSSASTSALTAVGGTGNTQNSNSNTFSGQEVLDFQNSIKNIAQNSGLADALNKMSENKTLKRHKEIQKAESDLKEDFKNKNGYSLDSVLYFISLDDSSTLSNYFKQGLIATQTINPYQNLDLIFYSVEYSSLNCLTFLLEKGCDLNKKYLTKNNSDYLYYSGNLHWEVTLLFWAVHSGAKDIVELLLKNGADKTMKSHCSHIHQFPKRITASKLAFELGSLEIQNLIDNFTK